MTHHRGHPTRSVLQPTAARTRPTPPPEAVITVQGLCKRYGQLEAVRGIDFWVRPGEIFGLIGPDGAGKTTTFQILAGVMQATDGQVNMLGRSPREARLHTGYLTQQFSLYLDLSVDENIRYSAGLRNIPPARMAERRDRYLRLMGLEAFGDRLAGQLSGGMKQKLALCCALVSQPDVLLLDEPTTGVDPVSRREFWDILATLASQGVTMVVATPYLDEAERCHRIALMYQGVIQEMGTLRQLRQTLGLSRLEVRSPSLAAVEQALLAQMQQAAPPVGDADASSADPPPPVLADLQTFGDRLDVLVPSWEAGEQAIHAVLEPNGLTLTRLDRAEVTLENVFVTRLRQQDADPPFIPFPRSHNRQALSPTSALAIQTERLSKQFGGFQAVQEVTLGVRYGEIYGLLGANGAGKTTTIKMLCGLLQPSDGHMVLAGQTQNLRSPELRRRIGYMSQKFTLYDDLSVVQNLEFYCGVYGVPRSQRRNKIDWVIATCGLTGQEQMLTGRLPGGWKQRVAFGASVMHEPEILFLDEPTSGVDPLARRQFWRLIEDFARQGTAILVTTHYLEEAEHCHSLGFMVAGAIVAQGSPSQIKAAQPGQLIELTTNHPQLASDLLKTQLAPWRVSIFGDRLHVVLDHPETELPQIQHLIQTYRHSNGTALSIEGIRPVPFSLEDCFIGIVERASRV